VHYSSQSFRRGGATFAFCREAPTAFIILAEGNWKSDAYLVYLTLSTAKKFKILNSITSRLDDWMKMADFKTSSFGQPPALNNNPVYDSKSC